MTSLRARPGTTTPVAAGLVLTLACLGQFLVVLDVSIVNVALPSIRHDLHFDPTALQWVVNAYALTFAGLLLLGGRAADHFGSKRVFLAGLGVFALASLVGGVAPTAGVLLAARAVQGLGAAVLSPASLTILTTTFTETHARTKAVATWSAAGAGAGAIGSVLGGLLTEYLSWRWVLLVNVPIGLAVCAVTWWALHSDQRHEARRLDLAGAILVTGGLSAVVFGTVQTDTHGWGSALTLVPIAAGVALLAAFVLVEARFAAQPLLPLRLLRIRSLSYGDVVMLLIGAAFFSMWYFLSLYMQGVLHYDAVQAGLGFLPHTVCIIAGARSAPRLMRRIGPVAVLAGGAALAAAGFLWQAGLTAHSGYAAGVLGPGVLMCLGSGLMFTPVAAAATGAVQRADAGLASGLLNTSRQVGGALGLAALSTLAAAPADPVAGYRHAFLAAAGCMVLVAVLAPFAVRTD